MLRSGDIVKHQYSGIHAVVGDTSEDGFVLFGYLVNDRTEIRWSVKEVDLVYSTEETVVNGEF